MGSAAWAELNPRKVANVKKRRTGFINRVGKTGGIQSFIREDHQLLGNLAIGLLKWILVPHDVAATVAGMKQVEVTILVHVDDAQVV